LEAMALALEDIFGAQDEKGDGAPAPSPAAVALSGQMQDICLVKGGRSIRPALLYSDVRATREADDVRRALGPAGIAAQLANFKGAAACLSKWLWLQRHEPEVLAAADHMLLGAHSYLAYVLTGGEAAGCDPTTASTTGLLIPPTMQCAALVVDDGAPLPVDKAPGGGGISVGGDLLSATQLIYDSSEGGVGRGGAYEGGVELPRWSVAAVSSFEGLDAGLLPRLVEGSAPAPVGVVARGVLASLG